MTWALAALGFLAPLQLYVPGLSIPPLITVVAAAVIVLNLSRCKRRPPAAAITMGLLAFVTLLALLHSTALNAGITTLIYFCELAGLLWVGSNLDPLGRPIIALLRFWTLGAAVDAVMVIFFRIFPDAELAWFHSGIARLFIATGTLNTLFTTSPNNALAPDKAGAFFVNANEGSAMLGVAYVMCLLRLRVSKNAVWLLPAALFSAAIFASGSKTGMALYGLITGALALSLIPRGALRAIVFPPAIVGIIYAAVVFVANAGNDLVSRNVLWSTAVQAIQTQPLTGLGFGGWEGYAQGIFALVGSSSDYPPHNLILYTWIETGVAGVIALLAFFVLVTVRLLASRTVGASLALAAVVWTFLHSMGDNTSVFNDLHTMPMLALLVGSYLSAKPSAERAVQPQPAPAHAQGNDVRRSRAGQHAASG